MNPLSSLHRAPYLVGVHLLALFGNMVSSQALAAADIPEPAPSPSSTAAASAPSAAPVESPAAVPAGTPAEKVAKVQSLLDAKRYAEALGELEYLLKSDARNAKLLKLKGFALRESGKLGEAVTAYLDALKIKPDLHEAKEYLAVTYLRMGEVKTVKQLHKELKKDAPQLARMLEAEAKKLKVKL